MKLKTVHTAVLLPITAVAMLGACANPTGGVAFKVGEESVSVKQVSKAAEGCVAALGPSLDPKALANGQFAGMVAAEIGKANNVPITQTAQEKIINEANLGAGLKNADCAQALRSYANLFLVSNVIGVEKLQEGFKNTKVELNPQYGVWSGTEAVASGSGSLSSAAPETKDSER